MQRTAEMQRTATLLAAGAMAMCSLFTASASAASLYAVHGINGTDLGPNFEQELPVDITLVNPDESDVDCLEGVEFKDRKNKLDVDQVGDYEVKVTLADGNGCGTGTLVVADTVNVSSLDFAIILAHLDASNTPVVRKYNLNPTGYPSTFGRASVIHAAVAPPVLIEIKGGEKDTFQDMRNGEQTFPLTVGAGQYKVRIFQDGDLVAKKSVSVKAATTSVGIVVGSAVNQTLEVFRFRP